MYQAYLDGFCSYWRYVAEDGLVFRLLIGAYTMKTCLLGSGRTSA